MSDGIGPDQGWKREDLHFVLDSEPPRYLEYVDGPVQYVTVAAAGETLGYLWFDDARDAANFVFSVDGGNRARNARGAWIRELLSAKSNGLAPSQAVAELAAEAGNARIGWIVTGSLVRAESVSAIEALAGASQTGTVE